MCYLNFIYISIYIMILEKLSCAYHYYIHVTFVSVNNIMQTIMSFIVFGPMVLMIIIWNWQRGTCLISQNHELFRHSISCTSEQYEETAKASHICMFPSILHHVCILYLWGLVALVSTILHFSSSYQWHKHARLAWECVHTLFVFVCARLHLATAFAFCK